MAQRPPDLDAQGRPITAGAGERPPDLDAGGKPIVAKGMGLRAGLPSMDLPGAAEFDRANQQFGHDSETALVDSLNPVSLVKGVGRLVSAGAHAVAHPIDTANAVINAPYGDLAKNAVESVHEHPGTIAGQLTGALIAPKITGVISGQLRRIAPKVADAGLWRTAAQRLDFPNTPQRLVDEGILPSQAQAALTETEGRVNAATKAFDARRPNLGAPINPTDPNQIAKQAQDFATTEGRVGALGNVPGPEAQEIEQAGNDYLAQNTRDRSLTETIDQKRAYAARSRYNNRPNAPTQTNERVNFNKGVAAANRQAAIAADPALEGELAREQDLMGAVSSNALADAKGTPLVGTGMIRKMVLRPDPMTGAGIGLDRTGQLLQHPVTRNLLRAAILARLGAQ